MTSPEIVPLCIDLGTTEVLAPLDVWQGVLLDKNGVRQLVQDLSDAAEKSVPPQDLDRLFERMWPDLEVMIGAAVKTVPQSRAPRRDEQEMLAELVDRVRQMERDMASLPTVRNTLNDVKTLLDLAYPAESGLSDQIRSQLGTGRTWNALPNRRDQRSGRFTERAYPWLSGAVGRAG